MDIVNPFFKGAVSLWASAQTQAWGPLVMLCRTAALALFRRIELGRLAIYEGGSKSCTFYGAEKDGLATVILRVRDDKFWVRLALLADMGFAESYMLGEVQCPDLTSFFTLFIHNKSRLSNGSTFTSSISTGLAGLARRSNGLKNARLNISAHYDISNEMFAAFLSPDMTYSCPIWLPKSDPASESETLEEAQHRKLQRFIDNAHIKSSDRVLEIGTGWGSFAIQAVQKTGCTVTTVTLSSEQKDLAEQRIRDASLSHKITVQLCDYRDLKLLEGGAYDKIISIEMLEAVGREFLTTYFGVIDRLLKKEGGVAVFQCITIPEKRYEAYARSDDFIRKYIFPGGHLPSITQLVQSISVGSSNSLIVEHVENIGPHYAKALRLWREEFLKRFETEIKQALWREHGKEVRDDDAAEVFRRKWDYYFCYSEAGFRSKTLGDVIVTVGREGAVQMMEDVPL